jgi:hypothetical protein
MDKAPLLSNREQLVRQFRRRYSAVHSASLTHFFKPYTTNVTSPSGAHYEAPIVSTIIASERLNPFGRNTLFEGVAVGPSKPASFESDPEYIYDNRDDVRSYGFKNPLTFVGPGYDIHGYPIPNQKAAWTASGVYGNSPPAALFRTNDTGSTSVLLSDVPESLWKAGPLDMRWDQYRKVWTSRYGVYPGFITAVRTLDSSPTTDPQFRSNIEYDAVINDGASTGIVVTGIRPRNYFPTEVNYKVYALPTGWPCLIFDDRQNDRPVFSIMAMEPPYTTACDTGEIAVDAGYLTVSALSSDPLSATAGGTGQSYYEYKDILVGTSGHTLERRNLMPGTGIVLDWSATGILTVHLDPSIDFVLGSGVNFSITALSGLTTPLSISQGGTGSSTKNFVDLSTSQSIAGYKTFTSGIRYPSGTTQSPSIACTTVTNHGLGYVNGYGLTLHASGVVVAINPSGLTSYQSNDIKPLTGYYPSLRVRQRDSIGVLDSSGNLINHSTHIQTWDTYAGTTLACVDSSGRLNTSAVRVHSTGDLSEYGEILSPAITGRLSYRLPSVTGTLATLESVYRGITPWVNPTANYAVLLTDEVILASTGITITLPNATTANGRKFTVKDSLGASATNNITVATSPTGQLIDNSHLLTLDINYVSYTVFCDGSRYHLI